MIKFIDCLNVEMSNGSIININETVNGEEIFIMLDINKLDIRYASDISRKYEYDVINLLSPHNGSVDWEILGNLHDHLKNYY